MEFIDFKSKIEYCYGVITQRIQAQSDLNNEKKLFKDRVSFEDINLDDILDDLIKLIPPILEYNKYFSSISTKIYKVYVAALCEIAKRGFSQGGILKTIDKYIGFEFDRNRHYDLLNRALQSERIEVRSEYAHKYEETIIYESGIPKEFHRKAFYFFEIYWRWFKSIDIKERHVFLERFLTTNEIEKIYFLDYLDFHRIRNLLEEMDTYRAKLLKTCKRFELVFSAIDNYIGCIDEKNIEKVCEEINEDLGFNIFTVIRLKEINKIFINYSQKVSFSNFEKLINTLNNTEKIILPNGVERESAAYREINFICGIHIIRDIEYEVGYPIGFSLEELLKLQKNKIHYHGKNVIYLSEDNFEVEIDGDNKIVREVIYNSFEGYVFIGSIPSASIANIDGKRVGSLENTKFEASIKKRWNRETKTNELYIKLNEYRLLDKSLAMTSVTIECQGATITKSTNSNGYLERNNKDFTIKHTCNVKLNVIANGKIINEKLFELKDVYIFGLQNQMYILDKIDLSQWIGDNRIIIFSKREIESCKNLKIERANDWIDYFVYVGYVNFDEDSFELNEHKFSINKKSKVRLSFSVEDIILNDILCYYDLEKVQIVIDQLKETDLNNYIIRINHCSDEPIERNLDKILDNKTINIYDCVKHENNHEGIWNVQLFYNQQLCNSASFAIISRIFIKNARDVFKEGEDILLEIGATAKIFYGGGLDLHDSTIKNIGNAKLQKIGNLIKAEPIEFSVYNQLCGVWQSETYIPNVWNVSIRNEDSEWLDINKKLIKYEDISRFNIFVCCNRQHNIKIQSGSSIVNRELQPGYNKINLNSIVESWNEITRIEFIDNKNAKEEIRVSFLSKITGINFSIEHNQLNCRMFYQGPVNAKMKISCFCGSSLITSIDRIAMFNKTSIKFIVFNLEKFNNSKLKFEVKFGDKDAVSIGEYFVDNYDATIGEQLLESLNKYKSLYELLKLSCGDEIVNLNSKKLIFSLLQ